MYDLTDDGYFLIYRKDMKRSTFDNTEDINHHDPSSSEITEGSSKEGTMESTDEVCNTGEGAHREGSSKEKTMESTDEVCNTGEGAQGEGSSKEETMESTDEVCNTGEGAQREGSSKEGTM